MRKLLIFVLLFAAGYPVMSRHITGGEMFYEYLGSSGNGHNYRVTLKLYRDCYSSGAQLDLTVQFGVFSNGTNSLVRTESVNRSTIEQVTLGSISPCISNPPQLCYEVGYYVAEINLPSSPSGYTISFQRCCRVGGIENVLNSSSMGVTYLATIPGSLSEPTAPVNNSARFKGKDDVLICANSYFEYDFGAADPDRGDVVTYELCEAYMGGSMNSPSPSTPDAPPYNSVPYSPGYSGGSPMGMTVSINPSTGLVSGTAPYAGIYVLTVCASEYRNGKLINVNRKDIQVAVAGCLTTDAILYPEYQLCESFTFSPRNRNNSPLINAQQWDFGVAGTNTDISNEMNPTFTFPDTGTYTVTLTTNPGQDCSDVTTTTVRVYPGFRPGFRFFESCATVPISFEDTTTTRYGTVNYRHWDFGDINTLADTSDTRNPTYTYGSVGTRLVTMIVGTSKGCRDTISSNVNVLLKPPIQLTNDTLICTIDTLQLNANGIGTFTWSPNYMISSTTGPSPLVSPDVPTKYYVNLVTVPGCENIDSVFVDTRSFVTIDAGRDTTICQTDSITLRPSGDALGFTWTPDGLLNNNRLKTPKVAPAVSTTFTVEGTIGKCSATSSVTVNVVPYPEANAGPDHIICLDSSAILIGSYTGAFFNWSPLPTLSNIRSMNPVASPKVTTSYILTVTDTVGCPKPFRDTTVVNVMPEVMAFAGNDTLVVSNQPLQLNASGGELYEWTPPVGLNDPFSQRPLALLTEDVSYSLKVITPYGCYAYDTLHVKVFKTGPDIFVPNAFTPNADGHNDVLKAIPVGILKFDYFRVYNRWGQQVFGTTDPTRGWDGMVNGKPQSAEGFVWMAAGTDYMGNPMLRKGTVVLVR